MNFPFNETMRHPLKDIKTIPRMISGLKHNVLPVGQLPRNLRQQSLQVTWIISYGWLQTKIRRPADCTYSLPSWSGRLGRALFTKPSEPTWYIHHTFVVFCCDKYDNRFPFRKTTRWALGPKHTLVRRRGGWQSLQARVLQVFKNHSFDGLTETGVPQNPLVC